MEMRVLDIDLDFFLSDCCPLAEHGFRPSVIGHEPWPEDRVRRFLETNCGLNKQQPTRGRVFLTHDSALQFWAELIDSGLLTVPFHLTHIDAHSDLGIGKPGPGFVLNSVLAVAPNRRVQIEKYYSMKQLDEANYLLFALAFRWICSLENVRNPKSRPDIPSVIAFKDESGEYCRIRLDSLISRLKESVYGSEPYIGFKVFDDYTDFSADAPYDFVSFAISPRYLPKEAEHLIDVAKDYILTV